MPPSRREQARQRTNASNYIYDRHTKESLRKSLEGLDEPLSFASLAAVEEAVNAAANDPYGDGDQSLLPNPSEHPLRAAWSSGLDVQLAVLSEEEAFLMHRSAFMLDIEDVTDLIREAKRAVENGDPDAMNKVLERRVSLLRVTPLHYVCHSARFRMKITQKNSDDAYAVVDALCKAGARVDARDIAGYTPLSTAAGFHSTPCSLRLARLLVSHGADPNVTTRFGEGLLVPPIICGNIDSFRELLRLGADASLADQTGLTPRTMAACSPQLLGIMTEVQREKTLQVMICNNCGKTGASKYCSACHKVYYCDKTCQKAGWKASHKKECGKDSPDAEFLDIDVETMTSEEAFPGLGVPSVMYMNNITGAVSNKTMSPKKYNTYFTVKVSDAIPTANIVPCVKLNIKNSDFLLVSPTGAGHTAHERLRSAVKERGLGLSKIYLNAKWLGGGENGTTTPARRVLRLDLSNVIPAPKQAW